MKKELLLSALLGSTALSQLSVIETVAFARSTQNENEARIRAIFESEAVMVDGKSVKLRATFLKAGVRGEDYTFDGDLYDLDYEVDFRQVDAVTGEILNSTDSTYYVKKVASDRYEDVYNLYNCDSTSTCDEAYKDTFTVRQGTLEFINLSETSIANLIQHEAGFGENVIESLKKVR